MRCEMSRKDKLKEWGVADNGLAGPVSSWISPPWTTKPGSGLSSSRIKLVPRRQKSTGRHSNGYVCPKGRCTSSTVCIVPYTKS